jgi:hypothetical protein
LPLASDNFLKDSLEIFRNPPFWIVGFRLAEVRDVTDVIALSILVDVFVIHLLSGNFSDQAERLENRNRILSAAP